MSTRFTPHHTALGKTIDEQVVGPHVRGALHPDMGTAKLSHGFWKKKIGSTNVVHAGFWSSIAGKIEDFFTDIADFFEGLKEDEVLVDLQLRTPQGVKLFPNIPLHVNATDDRAKDVVMALKQGHTIHVKVTYDGGRPSECTPVSWRIDFHNVEQIEAAHGGDITASMPGALVQSYQIGSASVVAPSNGAIPPDVAQIIQNAANKAGIDPRYLAAYCWQETDFGRSSNYNAATGHDKDSNAGVGLFQLDPSSGASASTLARAAADPQFAADYAAGMIANSLKGNGVNGNLQLAAQYYNGGPNYMHSSDAVQYGQDIMQKYALLQAQYPTSPIEGFGPGISDGRVARIAVHTDGFGTTRSASKYRFQTQPSNELYGFTRDINAAGALFKLDPNMIAAAIVLRSGGNAKYIDGTGRMGLFALNPADFQNLFESMQNENADLRNLPQDPLHPTTSIFAGANYIADILDDTGRYKDTIIAIGLTAGTVSAFKAMTGDYSAEQKQYYAKFKKLWMRIQQNSERLAGDPLNARPEVTKQDQTHTSRATGYTGGTGV